MNPIEHHLQTLSRRELFQNVSMGIGGAALASMLAQGASGASRAGNPLAPKSTHFVPRAKNVIFLHMVGAPSHLDLYENKPVLKQNDGQPCPDELLEGQRFAFLRGHPKLLGTNFKFKRHGESGVELSELLPNLATVADNICMIKSIHTEHFNHAPAQLFFQTGFGRFGRPTLGSWVNYGLGTENQDLPGFVVLITGSVAGAGNSLWGSGFLPTVYQGIEFRSQGDPVLFLSNPNGVDPAARRRIVDSINKLNGVQLADVGDPEIATRITQYEMAYRMQTSVPELMDISQEPAHIHAMYGTEPGKTSFANNCLLARRLVERGTRFVQLFDQGWDHHGSVFSALPNKCKQVDQPIAALIKDLKQRGLLEDTLVVWGAEFGRTPLLQSDRAKAGRDHHKDAYCVWMAGGGSRGGATIGKTDELGYFPVEDKVHVNDFHATLLHLLGLDHERLTYKFQGRKFRLTDIGGNVITKALA
ncbi:MAG: sulfatase [Planctomycetaceae bacterium]|nr:sulfatase [Planctomycetaceae bacterium]